jgi:4a-hydroxytetrahydrobiopterin dehydratase
MKPSSAPKKISRAQARNAVLLNQFATPGLGSLLAGRKLAGSGQVVLSIIGFALVTLWFVQMMMRYYGQMFGDTTVHNPVALGNLLIGGGLFALAWVWSLQTGFSLLREASKVSLDSLETFAAGQVKMEPAKIILALSTLPKWARHGEIISRTFAFKDFPAAMKFVNAVAELAEQAQHHPDVDIRWNKVTLALTTHDAGGLTEKDFELARQIDGQGRMQDAE